MARHECPDCGASHEMSAEGRIKRLEERVRELEACQPCTLPHYYYPVTITPPYRPNWTWTSGTPDFTPNTTGPVTVYGMSSSSMELT